MSRPQTPRPMMTRPTTLPVLLLLAAAPMAAAAEPSEAGEATPAIPAKRPLTVGDELPRLAPDTWTLRIEPRAWYVGFSGEVQHPGAGASRVDVRDLQTDQPRLRPAGEFNIQSGPLLLTLSGASASSGQASVFGRTATVGALALTPGTPIEARLRVDALQASVGYRVFTYLFDDRGHNAVRVHALAGVRYWDVESTVSVIGGGTTRFDRASVNGYVGARASLQLVRSFDVDVELNIGAGSGTSGEVAAAFAWKPVDWAAVEVGYRVLFLNGLRGSGADRSGFEGKLAGLFVGVVLRF